LIKGSRIGAKPKEIRHNRRKKQAFINKSELAEIEYKINTISLDKYDGDDVL